MSGESENEPDHPQGAPKKLAVEPRLFRPKKTEIVEEPEAVQDEESDAVIVQRLAAEEQSRSKVASRFEANDQASAISHVKPKFQPRDESGDPALQAGAANWGKATKRSSRWMVMAGVAALLVIIGGLAIQPLLQENRGRSESERAQVVEDIVNDEGSPTQYFAENADEVARALNQTLRKYAQARNFEEVKPLVRDSERLQLRLIEYWQPWDAAANWNAPDAGAMGYGSVGNRPYAFMRGQKPNYEPFQLFFVREEGKMLIDWEASEGIGTHTFEELRDPALKEAIMRVVASPAVYFTQAFDEKRYRAFQLAGIDGVNYVWGYAGIGTPAEETLTRMFTGGYILNDRTSSQPVRVRLTRGPDVGLPNQWLILDVLHKGWVAP